RRIQEGAAMIRTKGEAGTGNVVEAVRHMRIIQEEIRKVVSTPADELPKMAKEYGVSLDLLLETKIAGRLPVVNFAAGGIATPSDAALMRILGADGIFVGSGIFKSSNPQAYARAIVRACTYYDDPKTLLEVSEELGEAMPGQEIAKLEVMLQERGW
ncbi:MAG: pyridoxal 5'-phosphate synthase lyase subunit PdxS, partial [bacterium]